MEIVIAVNALRMIVPKNALKAFHIVKYFFNFSGPAHDPNSCGYSIYDSNGKFLEGVYTRVHRDTQIINAMRKWMGLKTFNDFSILGLDVKCWKNKNDNFSEALNFLE